MRFPKISEITPISVSGSQENIKKFLQSNSKTSRAYFTPSFEADGLENVRGGKHATKEAALKNGIKIANEEGWYLKDVFKCTDYKIGCSIWTVEESKYSLADCLKEFKSTKEYYELEIEIDYKNVDQDIKRTIKSKSYNTLINKAYQTYAEIPNKENISIFDMYLNRILEHKIYIYGKGNTISTAFFRAMTSTKNFKKDLDDLISDLKFHEAVNNLEELKEE